MADRLDREYDRDPSLWRTEEEDRRHRLDWNEADGGGEGEPDVERANGESETVMERSEGQEQPRRRNPGNPSDAKPGQKDKPRQAGIPGKRREAADERPGQDREKRPGSG